MRHKNLGSMLLGIIMLFVLSACGGGSGGGGGGATAGTTTTTAKQGVTLTISKDDLVAAKTTGKTVHANTLDPRVKYATVTVTDANGNMVPTEKVDIYTLNNNYITGTIPLEPGNYNLTQFFVHDAGGNVLYLVPTQSATADIKQLVSKVLPIGFSVAKDIANTIRLQVIAGNFATPKDYGYPSVIFDVVDSVSFMTSAQVLDKTIENWLLVDATLTINGVPYSLPADKTAYLHIAIADSYTLVYTKSGYVTRTFTFTAAEMVKYQDYPLVVVLTPGPTPTDEPAGSQTFGVGTYSFTVPEGKTTLTYTLKGARGGLGGNGWWFDFSNVSFTTDGSTEAIGPLCPRYPDLGDKIVGTLAVNPGQVLTLVVGASGTAGSDGRYVNTYEHHTGKGGNGGQGGGTSISLGATVLLRAEGGTGGPGYGITSYASFAGVNGTNGAGSTGVSIGGTITPNDNYGEGTIQLAW